MPFILLQPSNISHINKFGYTLRGAVTSDATTSRRVGYVLHDVEGGNDVFPMRTFDPIVFGRFFPVSFQKNMRAFVNTPLPNLFGVTTVQYPSFDRIVRLDSYLIEIDNVTCDRVVTPDQTGREITVINGVLSFNEEDSNSNPGRNSQSFFHLTNKYNAGFENNISDCLHKWIYVYSVGSSSILVEWKDLNFPGSSTSSILIDDGCTAISLNPDDYTTGYWDEFTILLPDRTTFVISKCCKCDEDEDELFALHPWGGYDAVEALSEEGNGVQKQNQVVRINDKITSQNSTRNTGAGYTTINNETKDLTTWIRYLPDTRISKDWISKILATNQFAVLTQGFDFGTDRIWRNFVVESSSWDTRNDDDEIELIITGYYNQPIAVQ